MQAACTHCGTEHVLKDTDVGTHPKVQFRCSKCGRPTIVENTRRAESTSVISPLPSFARANTSGASSLIHDNDDTSKLPEHKNVVLTIISGPDKGTTHKLSKPRIVLGRDGADIDIHDAEVSRHHCILEVRGEYVHLRDLDSTNGTFYEEERARAAMLQNGSEFRIGTTVLRLNFEPM
jgi:pSer/pThr/pTyr-binding forkhead associated (FHA) protein